MSALFGLSPSQIRGIPLLRGLRDDQLTRLAGRFSRVDAAPGDILFEAGARADALYLLVQGDITLLQGLDPPQKLSPPVFIGELGAMTGIPRRTAAKVGEDVELWRAEGTALWDFFDVHTEIGLTFVRNLMSLAAEKVHRDATRLEDMRANIVSTQKRLKKTRDFLLESADTVVSDEVHATVEAIIEQNRRVNYRVKPPEALAATLRTPDGGKLAVQQLSRTHLTYALVEGGSEPAEGDRVGGVLCLAGPEIPVDGRVVSAGEGRARIELDLLVDDYAAALEGFLTNVQMTDVLV